MSISTRTLGASVAGLLAAITLLPSHAQAQVTIIRNMAAGAPPATVAGGGNLQAIFNEAADWWEASLVTSPYTLTLTYRWGPLGGGTLGSHSLQAQGGSPHRETAGSITFDNDGSSSWFLDPTPCANSEYSVGPTVSSQNLGGGTINTGRTFTGGTGSASGRTDMFAVCLHEIGHALGLSSANTAFQAERVDNDVDVTAPRPFPGSSIPLSSSSAHIPISSCLMFPSIGTGLRRLPSATDALANAQVSQMTSINTLTSCPTTGGGGSPLTTTFANNNGGAVGGAVYFELECLDPAGLSISNLDLNVGGTGGVAGNCEIYIQPLAAAGTVDPLGTWAGPVSTGTTGSTSPAGSPTNFALSPSLGLGLNCRLGIAIVASGFAHAYTTGTGFPLSYTTTQLELLAGQASNVPFTAPLFNPRVVNTNIHYTSGGSCPAPASCTPQGSGCVAQFASFYEVMTPTAMDMSGLRLTAMNSGTTAAPAYFCTIGPAAINAIGSLGAAAALPLGDDQVLPAGTLGLEVSSNCQIFNGPGGSAGFQPSVTTFLGGPPSYTSSWTDLQPNAAGSGQVWYEQSGAIAQITYDGVWGWNTSNPNTVQFRINTGNGNFTITWGALATTNPEDWLVGFSAAGLNLDPGPSNISSLSGQCSFANDAPPLGLECIGRPVQGPAAIDFNVRTTNIPSSALIHLGVIGLTRPGLPLGFIGFPPSCVQWASPDLIRGSLFLPQPTPGMFTWRALTLPALPPSFAGFQFNLQSVTLDLSGIGPTTRVSNGLKCVVGTL